MVQDEDRKAVQTSNSEIDTTAREPAISAGPQTQEFSIGGRVLFGAAVIGLLTAGIGAWAATAELTGAVMAQGSVVVDKNVKKVQHRDGGIVAKINVKNGDKVQAGEVLIELDDTQIKAELSVVRGQLTELTARKARLAAEVAGIDALTFPKGFETGSAHASEVAQGERNLFRAGRDNLKGQIQQLALQIEQLREEIEGIQAQKDSKEGQLDLIRKELKQLQALLRKKLTSATRVYALEREEKRLGGELGGLIAQMARTKGKINETRVQILSTEQSAKLQAQRELRSTESKIAELREREIAAADRLKRTRLFAPQSGTVHELTAHTVGGVVTSAETVLVVVPNNERLIIEGRFSPVDIDQVYVGREARMRFSAFNQRTTPEIDGRIVRVSADVTSDPKTSQQYYLGQVEIDSQALHKLKDLKLLPGMPVEIFVSTGTRTALSYLTKPLTDQFNRAFREE